MHTKNVYKCDKCNYVSKYKHCLLQHQNRKTSCQFSSSDKNLLCFNCGKHFKCTTSIYRHRKVCKLNETQQETNNSSLIEDTKYNELLQEIQTLQSTVSKILLIKENNSKNNNVTVNNSENVQVNNINVNIYGHENKNMFTEKRIVDILQKPSQWFTTYPKLLHFDTNYPENHNIKMTRKDAREGFIQLKIDNSNTWSLECKKQILSEKFTEIINDINAFYDDYGESLKPCSHKDFNREMNRLNEDKQRIVQCMKQLEATIISNTISLYK